MRSAAFLLAAVSFALASTALAQEEEEQPPIEGPEWPDPGSEEPGAPQLFPKDPTTEEYEGGSELELEVPETLAEPIYRWSWYGWRNLIGDGVAAILVISGWATQIVPLIVAGAITYGVGGPIAHFTAGNWGRALISFGMRVVGPGLIALAAFATMCAVNDGCADDNTTLAAVGIGGAIGTFIAHALDVSLVAREQVQVETKVAVTPAIRASKNGPKTIGLAVQF